MAVTMADITKLRKMTGAGMRIYLSILNRRMVDSMISMSV